MSELQIIAATDMNIVEAQYVEMAVPLYSYGCERKIKKALAHFKGIYSVNVDFHQQKVTVWGICNKYDVLATIQGKRRGAHFWNSMDNTIDEQMLISQTTPSSPSTTNSCPDRTVVPRLALMIKARSLGWKTWKKVFLRSYSF